MTSTFETPTESSDNRSNPFFSRASVSRPCGSKARAIHEPSSGNALRTNSALKPGSSVNVAGSVAAVPARASFQLL